MMSQKKEGRKGERKGERRSFSDFDSISGLLDWIELNRIGFDSICNVCVASIERTD